MNENGLGVIIPGLEQPPLGPLSGPGRQVLTSLLLADVLEIFSDSYETLQHQLCELDEWTDRQVGSTLWRCQMQGKRRRPGDSDPRAGPLTLSGAPIPWVPSYTYLGAVSLSDLTHTEKSIDGQSAFGETLGLSRAPSYDVAIWTLPPNFKL
jgi:hypothetical protein